jgi:hypothetical protein
MLHAGTTKFQLNLSNFHQSVDAIPGLLHSERIAIQRTVRQYIPSSSAFLRLDPMFLLVALHTLALESCTLRRSSSRTRQRPAAATSSILV